MSDRGPVARNVRPLVPPSGSIAHSPSIADVTAARRSAMRSESAATCNGEMERETGIEPAASTLGRSRSAS